MEAVWLPSLPIIMRRIGGRSEFRLEGSAGQSRWRRSDRRGFGGRHPWQDGQRPAGRSWPPAGSWVGLLLLAENIDTSNGSALTVLEIIEVFRRAKLSQAIKGGQAKALVVGKTIGRPKVAASLRRRVEAALAAGDGIRPTARRFGVAPATVVNIHRIMAQPVAEAA